MSRATDNISTIGCRDEAGGAVCSYLAVSARTLAEQFALERFRKQLLVLVGREGLLPALETLAGVIERLPLVERQGFGVDGQEWPADELPAW